MIFPLMRYALAVVSVGVALLISRLLDIYLVSAPVALLLSAIMVSGLIGGRMSATLAVALSLVAFVYFYVEPIHTLWAAEKEFPRTVIFSLSAVFVGWLSASQRTTTESLRSARDDLRETVQQLRTANEKLRAEDVERRRTAEELRQARADLTRVSRLTAMSELTGSLAHEVNQPLAAAVINANSCSRWLAGDEPNIPEARAAAARIVQDGTRAADIISRVRLLFTKGEEKREPVDVNAIISEMIVLLRGEATQHAVSIRTELAADLPAITGDRVQLQQVMMNLIMNAIDAMEETSGDRELAIASRRTGSAEVEVSVKDNGVGLPPERDRIFNPFYTTKSHGIGMGLSISRSIIESHGGRLWASAESARGASFHLTLPVASGAASAQPI